MRTINRAMRIAGAGALALGLSTASQAIVTDPAGLDAVAANEGLHAEHCDGDVASGDYEAIFICGDEFFEVDFNAAEGGGANVGDGGRYTRVPRPDLAEWRNQTPTRPTGPNSASCGECHSFPVGTAAGRAGFNVIRDPFHTGDPAQMIQRNTPMLMGSGALQLLAEEISEELAAIVAQNEADACAARGRVTAALVSKGVDYGTVTSRGRVRRGECRANSQIRADGIDRDLLVKPFQWKGSDISMRAFTRDALNNEIGIQAVEIVGDGVDGDFDGVADEASIADVTATAIYGAGQPRPVTEIELDELRDQLVAEDAVLGAALADELGLPDLEAGDIASINAGEATFDAIGCGDCHMPQMALSRKVFSEPSVNPNYRDNGTFPGGQSADIATVAFDITTDMLDNHIELGGFFRNMANFETDGNGDAVVALYGDLKRHDMGPGLAENVDEQGFGASVWMTKELWGVGSTPPYLHDGRATTVTEAILLHGGEAQAQRDAFAGLTAAEQADLTRFLRNLVILKVAEEE